MQIIFIKVDKGFASSPASPSLPHSLLIILKFANQLFNPPNKSSFHQKLTFQNSLHFIELKNFYGCLPNDGMVMNHTFYQLKMVKPLVSTRIEKADDGFGIVQKSAQVGSFIWIANAAAIGKIIKVSNPSVLKADHVINMESE